MTPCYSCANLGRVVEATTSTDEGHAVCSDCARVRQLRGLDGPGKPSATAVVDRRLLVGINPDGSRPDGAVSWEWRPPRTRPDLHHDTPLVLGRVEVYQQSPPVHVKGVPFKSAPSRAMARVEVAHDHAAAVTVLATLTAEERVVYELRHVDGLARTAIAKRRGVSLVAVKRTLERAMAKLRGAVL